jgi:hypothetical protein
MKESNDNYAGSPLESIDSARRLCRKFFMYFFIGSSLGLVGSGWMLFTDFPKQYGYPHVYIGGMDLPSCLGIITMVFMMATIWYTSFKVGRLLNDTALTVMVIIMPFLVGLMPTYIARAGAREGYRMGAFLGKFRPIKK